MRFAAILLSLAGAAWSAPASAPLPPLAAHLSLGASSLFEATVQRHFREAKGCWGQRRIPSARMIRAEIDGILEGCSRGWPGDAHAPYRIFALMLTESGGKAMPRGPNDEQSFGPCCVSVPVTRFVSGLWALPCPRSSQGIIDLHLADPRWSMLVACAAVWRNELATGGDRTLGILIFKYGDAGLARAVGRMEKGQTLADLPVWKHYAKLLSWVECLRLREQTGTLPPDCGCFPPESLAP